MEQDRGARPVLLRGLLVVAAGGATAHATTRSGLAQLDVASWGLVAALGTAAVLTAAPQAARRVVMRRRHRAPVVLPDAAPSERRDERGRPESPRTG